MFWLAAALSLPLLAGSGCRSSSSVEMQRRYRRGIVLVLPGIEGRSVWNRNIARGLDDGGVASAIEICDWTSGVPGDLVGNLANLERNRREAREIARRIVDYHRRRPGRPVHLVGHSGGGGLAVLVLEALPPGPQVDLAILLAPALSPRHNLTAALRRTRVGLRNFYSRRDVTLLKVGTSLFGQIDRDYGPAAGAVGFEPPDNLSAADRGLYAARLRQTCWRPLLAKYGADGSHFGWASRRFAREYLAPLIIENEAARPAPAGGRGNSTETPTDEA